MKNKHPNDIAKIASAAQSLPLSQNDGLIADATNKLVQSCDQDFLINHFSEMLRNTKKNSIRFLQLGFILKKFEKWEEAIDTFERATKVFPNESRLWRELGIAQNKLHNALRYSANVPLGEQALIKSINLNPNDYDASGSLGGIYKRQGKFQKAIEMYDRSLKVSNGNPYPLLNFIILTAREKRSILKNEKLVLPFKQAETQLQNELSHRPPKNTPWSYFDLSTIYLLTNRREESFELFLKGCYHAKNWEINTHFDTLLLLKNSQHTILELNHIVSSLKNAH